MEMKRGTNECYIVSMTTTYCLVRQQIAWGTFLQNYFATPQTCWQWEKTWYTCILHHFQANNILFEQQIRHLIIHSCTHGDETWYACVLHHFHDDNRFVRNFLYYSGFTYTCNSEWRKCTFKNSANLKKRHNSDGKGDNIGDRDRIHEA